MIITADSHLDHHLTAAHLAFLLKHVEDREGVSIQSFPLPDELEKLPCGLYGPVMGDPPIGEDQVTYQRRGQRTYPSRLVQRPPRLTRTITAIVGPHEGHSHVLYTAYGGPSAPFEPADPELPKAVLSEAQVFWAVHALAAK